MIVPAHVVHRILEGRKTSTRVPAKTNRCRYRADRGYSVGVWTGAKLVTRCRVLVEVDPWQEPLFTTTGPKAKRITGPELRREGYEDLDSFIEDWLALHDRDWVRRHPDAGDGERDARFTARWAGAPVWRVEFSLLADETVFLAPASGYTQSAPRALQDWDERQGRLVAAETVAVEALDRGWQVRAQARHAKAMREAEVVRQERREQRSLGQRLDEATARAKARGAKVDTVEAAARKRIEIMERIADEREAA